MEDKYKNWKSFIAFFLFIIIYAFTVFTDKSAEVIEVTGFISLYATLFMMLRNEKMSNIVDSVNKVILNRFSK